MSYDCNFDFWKNFKNFILDSNPVLFEEDSLDNAQLWPGLIIRVLKIDCSFRYEFKFCPDLLICKSAVFAPIRAAIDGDLCLPLSCLPSERNRRGERKVPTLSEEIHPITGRKQGGLLRGLPLIKSSAGGSLAKLCPVTEGNRSKMDSRRHGNQLSLHEIWFSARVHFCSIFNK